MNIGAKTFCHCLRCQSAKERLRVIGSKIPCLIAFPWLLPPSIVASPRSLLYFILCLSLLISPLDTELNLPPTPYHSLLDQSPTPLRVETFWNQRIQLKDIGLVRMSLGVNERAIEQISEAEHVSEASSADQASKRAVRASKTAEEQMAQYWTRRFHATSSHLALVCPPG